MCSRKPPHVGSFMLKGLIIQLYQESIRQSGMQLGGCCRTSPVERLGLVTVTHWGISYSEVHLMDLEGSVIQESNQVFKASAPTVGHRCICMSILVQVRSMFQKQVRTLSLLPADMRVLQNGLRARKQASSWVTLNQKMFSNR